MVTGVGSGISAAPSAFPEPAEGLRPKEEMLRESAKPGQDLGPADGPYPWHLMSKQGVLVEVAPPSFPL